MRSERRLIQQAYRFELDPNRTQRVLLAKSVGASRYVYNWGLAESQRVSERTGRRPRLGDLKAQLVELKKRGALSRQRLLVALIAGSARSPLSANGKLSCRSR